METIFLLVEPHKNPNIEGLLQLNNLIMSKLYRKTRSLVMLPGMDKPVNQRKNCHDTDDNNGVVCKGTKLSVTTLHFERIETHTHISSGHWHFRRKAVKDQGQYPKSHSNHISHPTEQTKPNASGSR